MRIRDLYGIKGFPYVTVILSIFSFVLSCVVWLNPELFDFLCIETRPKYFWQYFIGCFIHSVEPRWSMWIHMGMNFMGLIPLGIITEKVIGTKKMFWLFLGELVATAVILQLVTLSNPGKASGISSISYAFATVAFYCVYKVIKKKEVSCLKQALFYYCVFEFWGMLQMLLLMNPVNAPMSFAGHISGIVVGIIAIILTEKTINYKIDG